MRPFDQFVSLGRSCGTKYQIELNGFRRDRPDGTVEEFEKLLYAHKAPSLRGRSRHFFDWMVAPFSSVVKLLASDFAGVFERENLVAIAKGAVVHDRAADLFFHHDFQPAGPALTRAELDAQYPLQRERYLHFREKFLALLRSDARVLYVVSLPREDRLADLSSFHGVMAARHPRHRYLLLAVRSGAARDRPIIRRHTPHEIRCQVRSAIDKHPRDRWSFDDGAWQAILDRYPWA